MSKPSSISLSSLSSLTSSSSSSSNNPNSISGTCRKVRAILRIRPMLENEIERERKSLSSKGSNGGKSLTGAGHARYSQYLNKLNLFAAASGNKQKLDQLPSVFEQPSSSAIGSEGGQASSVCSIPNPRNLNESIEYNFDAIYDNRCGSQEIIFKQQIEPLLSGLINEAINVTVFAYGPTSAGKSYTMFGNEGNGGESLGIIPRTINHLYHRISQLGISLRFSMFEIYNEKVFDLLTIGDELAIREDKDHSITIPNLLQVTISSLDAFQALYEKGRKNTSRASTALNADSSRSHTVILVTLVRESESDGGGRVLVHSKLHLIDLAGSEDNRRTDNTGQRLKESGCINRSLFVLGQVVDALNNIQNTSVVPSATKNSSTSNSVNLPSSSSSVSISSSSSSTTNTTTSRIPYRDSKLTRILQDSLGGKALSLIICNVAPTFEFLYETYRTLNFASKSRQITNFVSVNSSNCNSNNSNTQSLKNCTNSLLRPLLSTGKRKLAGRSSFDGSIESNSSNVSKIKVTENKKAMRNSYPKEREEESSDSDFVLSDDEKENEINSHDNNNDSNNDNNVFYQQKERKRKRRMDDSPRKQQSSPPFKKLSNPFKSFNSNNNQNSENFTNLVNETVKQQVDEKFKEWMKSNNNKSSNSTSTSSSVKSIQKNSLSEQVYSKLNSSYFLNTSCLFRIAALMTPQTRHKTALACLKKSRLEQIKGNRDEAALFLEQAQSLKSTIEEAPPPETKAPVVEVKAPAPNKKKAKSSVCSDLLDRIMQQQQQQGNVEKESSQVPSTPNVIVIPDDQLPALKGRLLNLLNEGSLKAIQSLKGIGPKRATALLESRSTLGPLQTLSPESLATRLKNASEGQALRLIQANLEDLYQEACKYPTIR